MTCAFAWAQTRAMPSEPPIASNAASVMARAPIVFFCSKACPCGSGLSRVSRTQSRRGRTHGQAQSERIQLET